MSEIPDDVKKLAKRIATEWGNDHEDVTTAQLAERAIMADRSTRPATGEVGVRELEWRDTSVENPKTTGPYECWCDAPPQSMSVQAVRWKEGTGWLTSWPVLFWRPYPADPCAALVTPPATVATGEEPVAWIVLLNYGSGNWSGEMLTDVLPKDSTRYKIVRPLYAHPPTGLDAGTIEAITALRGLKSAAELFREAYIVSLDNDDGAWVSPDIGHSLDDAIAVASAAIRSLTPPTGGRT